MSIQFRSHLPTGEFSRDLSSLFRLFDDYDVHRRGNHHLAPRPYTPDAYHLDGELPGVAQKDIEIEFSDAHNLIVKGRTEREYHHTEPETESEDSNKSENSETDAGSNKRNKPAAARYWASERTIGEFQRTFSFSTRVDQDAVTASLKGGVLSIVLPKAKAHAPKKITIQ
ncbi:30 kDa heat shock protein [Penicillium sp. IBT 35674x]|nr:30 kDa heat shock protein [Penicillium sp. IBT 35674x]